MPDDRPQRGPDRRTAARREADRTLHYARERLLAAALIVAEKVGNHPMAVVIARGPMEADLIQAMIHLEAVAADYKRAETDAFAREEVRSE